MKTYKGVTALAASTATLLLAASTARAGDLLVSSRFSDNVLRYDANTGDFIGVFATGHGMDNPNGIAYGPDGNLYVGQGDDPQVLRFHGQTGEFIDEFIGPATPGGLIDCRAIIFGPDEHLYVANGSGDTVLKYDGQTGDFLGVAAAGNGLDGPVGITFGRGGNLYVASALSNRVLVFGPGGVFVRTLTCSPPLSNSVGVLFDPAGRLFVTGSSSHNIVTFDVAAGTCNGTFAAGGNLSAPIHMILAPDGNLLVGSFLNDSVVKFDINTAAPMGFFITSVPGGLNGTHNFAYMPDPPPIPAASTFGLIAIAVLIPFAAARILSRRRPHPCPLRPN